ncbi:MAG: acyl-CoA dehydrogenase C-terminal domain-containing protein [Alphaproteobacteria bacterium]
MLYDAPVKDMRFLLTHIGKLNELGTTSLYQDLVSDDLVDAILTEAGRFSADILAPINRQGDLQGSHIVADDVRTPDGFKDAYQAYVEQGWASVSGPVDFGGQGLPGSFSFLVQEMVFSANLAFGLCPMLSVGAAEALEAHGSDELKARYLPKMISGEWTGAMDLTEPQAGSDVGALRAKAVPVDDGTYRITGNKIFITFGDHDFTDNVIHLVLARLPDAQPGTKGISLFLVPKFLVNDDGSIGARNDVKVTALEHKMGIHASPTCAMAFGEDGEGAVGYLIGAPHRGMAAMFTMMNNARLNVGIQGVAAAEAAYQQALSFAQDRVQGRAPGVARDQSSAIIEHPDVRRNLLLMKAKTEAARAICVMTAGALDHARALEDEAARERAKLRADFLTPIAKSWSTDIGVEVSSIGVQVHGGMGFIEETGAAQFMRDSRIAPIYEGTNGIQSIDLVMRKLPLDNGSVADEFFADIEETAAALGAHDNAALTRLAAPLVASLAAARQATNWLRERAAQNPTDLLAGATPYCTMMGDLFGGWLLAKKALIAFEEGDDVWGSAFVAARLETASFFASQILPQVAAGASAVQGGAAGLFTLDPIAMKA